MTIAGIWQVARSLFNSSKTSNPVRSGIITPLKNCDRTMAFWSIKWNSLSRSGVKPLWTRDRETDDSSTRIFSHSGVWMSLKLPGPTAMWSNYRNSWHSERNSLALIKSSGRSPVFCSSLSQSASNSALGLSRISAIVLFIACEFHWNSLLLSNWDEFVGAIPARDSFARAYQAYFLIGQLLSLARCLLFAIDG